MPNWCYQTLKVRGSNAELNRFLKASEVVQDDEWKALPEWDRAVYDLNKLVPCPKELEDTTSGFFGDTEKQKALEEQQAQNVAKYGYKTWYEWACDNWGTKWGACRPQLVKGATDSDPEGRGEIIMYFESAWGPANGLLEKISAQFPTLLFGIFMTEESDAFSGIMVFHNGDTVAEAEPELTTPLPEYPDEDGDADGELLDKYYEAMDKRQDAMNEMLEAELNLALDSEMSLITL